MMSRADAELVLELHNYDRAAGTRAMPEPARSEVKAALLVIDADDQAQAMAKAETDRKARRQAGVFRTAAELAESRGALRPRGA